MLTITWCNGPPSSEFLILDDKTSYLVLTDGTIFNVCLSSELMVCMFHYIQQLYLLLFIKSQIIHSLRSQDFAPIQVFSLKMISITHA